MTIRPAVAAAVAACLLAACVPIGDETMPKDAVGAGQRTLLLVFASPGPVYSEDDSKAETAAKIVPGLGLVVKSAQDDSMTLASKDLQRYLPSWDPAAEFAPILAKELHNSGHPGKWIELSDVPELTPDKLQAYNRASDVLDWQTRYYLQNPDVPVPRNYSTLLTLDDALIFEVNLEWGIVNGDEDKATPTLSAVMRLVLADSSHTVWRHEVSVSDAAGARTNYEFKVQPDDLLAKYRKLMPGLAQALVADYRKNLQAAGLAAGAMPAGAAAHVSVSTAAAASAGLPSGSALPYGMTADMLRPVTIPQAPAVGASTTTAR